MTQRAKRTGHHDEPRIVPQQRNERLDDPQSPVIVGVDETRDLVRLRCLPCDSRGRVLNYDVDAAMTGFDFVGCRRNTPRIGDVQLDQVGTHPLPVKQRARRLATTNVAGREVNGASLAKGAAQRSYQSQSQPLVGAGDERDFSQSVHHR